MVICVLQMTIVGLIYCFSRCFHSYDVDTCILEAFMFIFVHSFLLDQSMLYHQVCKPLIQLSGI